MIITREGLIDPLGLPALALVQLLSFPNAYQCQIDNTT